MEKIKSQREAVLRHLKDYGSITSMEAFEEYGITRLSGIIFNLREEYKIKTIQMGTKNRYGNNVNYAKYVLE